MMKRCNGISLYIFSSSSLEKTVLVMENLFYECDIKNKFDLKGSERNRLVDPINQQQGDIVLLDENFVQSNYELKTEGRETKSPINFLFCNI